MSHFEEMKSQARQLSNRELMRHARVSLSHERPDFCWQCFCCACVAVLREQDMSMASQRRRESLMDNRDIAVMGEPANADEVS